MATRRSRILVGPRPDRYRFPSRWALKNVDKREPSPARHLAGRAACPPRRLQRLWAAWIFGYAPGFPGEPDKRALRSCLLQFDPDAQPNFDAGHGYPLAE